MSEIEKMYENAEAELRKCSECNNNVDCGYGKGCYPPFTAEKQIELIKWCLDNYGDIFDSIETKWFEEQLCASINNLWQDLTEEEKQQIKEILE